MSDIGRKSIGELIDALVTADLKCYHAQDEINDPDATKALKSARTAQEMNKRRCDLIRAIDAKLGDGAISPSSKTY